MLTLNYVNEEFEKSVLNILPHKKGRSMHRNQVRRYGMHIPYDNNIVSKKIPEIFHFLENKIPFDSVTINEYLEGQLINWHTDSGVNDVYIISLLSDSIIHFRKGMEEQSIALPRYSMFRMTGELRLEWEHMLKVTERRISLVFRQS